MRKLKKKRNNSILGWRSEGGETLKYLDVENKVTSSTYFKRKYITVFGREFKLYDVTFARDSKIEEEEIKSVGFKN